MAKTQLSKTVQKKRSNTKVVLFIILAAVLFVLSLLVLTVFVVANNVQKIQDKAAVRSFTFSTSAGPVSPEYQSTKTMTYSNNGCTYTVVYVQPAHTDVTSCTLSEQTFGSQVSSAFGTIVDNYVDQNIAEAIKTNNNSPQTLIGGPERKMIVTMADGSTLQTNITEQFQAKIQSFLNSIQSVSPNFKQLGLTEIVF